MASSGKRTSTAKNTNSRKTSSQKKSTGTARNNRKKKRNAVSSAAVNEAALILLLAVLIFVFLCVIRVIKGSLANGISDIMFGLFGLLAYVVPLIVFLSVAFEISNKGNRVAVLKLVSGIVLLFIVGIFCFMGMKQESLISQNEWLKELYLTSASQRAGGGVIFGTLAHLLYQFMGFWGTLFFMIVLGIVCAVIITEKSFLSGVKKGGTYLYEAAREDMERIREQREEEYEFIEEEEIRAEKERRKKKEKMAQEKKPQPQEKVRRMDRKAEGVVPMSAVTLKPEKPHQNEVKADIHEIILTDDDMEQAKKENIAIEPVNQWNEKEPDMEAQKPLEKNFLEELDEETYQEMPEPVTEYTQSETTNVSEKKEEKKESHKFTAEEKKEVQQEENKIAQQINKQEETVKYMIPPLTLLKHGEGAKGDTSKALKETAYRLQQTLLNFGVKVTITDISQGPAVTRYEMQPEQGVKVSKIVGLADDIKLNLAATDIRIEAPIPGKAAVGIEVPNKENSTVMLRDLLETEEFRKFPSNLAFAVGKDIGGKVVVADIAKMPHVLIAGATGSGKSVCINTIIMSILYKANPNDVKMIMIDPKVVELSVYNGIPHLMIPVVTDPKKASAALHWGVAEMTDRYQKFAEMNVRDLKGYNKAVEAGKCDAEGQPLHKMPQIVIIVDELADLMMVAAGEVEESICRLAQLARAAGIHLIIATQRPSVDVITGLIKANMPSRIAFSVSSGVDSRTILDMNGAEKLLGKGDMLFYPQGYAKPGRVQGAFVSDSEVSDVVEFLKNQQLGNISYNSEIEEKIKSTMQSGVSSGASSSGGSEFDAYFADAGRFVIEKDKASIGMLQRVFKIGFNRAARIVDQLENAGVVGAEEGTKPRKILMSPEQFESFVEEHL